MNGNYRLCDGTCCDKLFVNAALNSFLFLHKRNSFKINQKSIDLFS